MPMTNLDLQRAMANMTDEQRQAHARRMQELMRNAYPAQVEFVEATPPPKAWLVTRRKHG